MFDTRQHFDEGFDGGAVIGIGPDGGKIEGHGGAAEFEEFHAARLHAIEIGRDEGHAGTGTWTRPGRGSIPYAWQVTPNWLWMSPSVLEMFYDQATDNDLFIGGLSGPGYMYAKAIPRDALPTVIAKSREFMEALDLNIFEFMDYSEGASIEGNPDLPQSLIDIYFKEMPDVTGFLNGYAPAYTFVHQDGRVLVSYDYYMSEGRSEEEVVSDLQELSVINDKRPYFLLMHVRNWSDITRVKAVLDELGSDFEVVPLDVFLKMAAAEPTFETYVRPEGPLQ